MRTCPSGPIACSGQVSYSEGFQASLVMFRRRSGTWDCTKKQQQTQCSYFAEGARCMHACVRVFVSAWMLLGWAGLFLCLRQECGVCARVHMNLSAFVLGVGGCVRTEGRESMPG